jgi:hypothetical protein
VRIKLGLFAALTTFGVLATACMAGLAIRSFHVGEALLTDHFVASSNVGRISFQHISADPRNRFRRIERYRRWDVPSGASWDNRFWTVARPRSVLGFAIVDNRPANPPYLEFYIGPVIVIPYWILIAACLVVVSALAIRTRSLMARKRDGRCAQCGYDLRATPERCPECGALVAGK